MRGSVRCKSLTLGGSGPGALPTMELHGKRLDRSSKRRVIRDLSPLIYGSLDLRAEYDRHVEGTRSNKGLKRPVLHFIVKFPDQILTDQAPAPYLEIHDLNKRKEKMLAQAVAFIDETHGGDAVFAARVDRDEAGELVVDLFAAPKYLKQTKGRDTGGPKTEAWISPTKFGKELCDLHRDEIVRRHPRAAPDWSGPRAVGIALQSQFSAFFERENGVRLEKTEKTESSPDRLETEAFKSIQDEKERLSDAEISLAQSKVQQDRREQDLGQKQQLLVDTARRLDQDLHVRGLASKERSVELDRREADLAKLERSLDLRETEIKRRETILDRINSFIRRRIGKIADALGVGNDLREIGEAIDQAKVDLPVPDPFSDPAKEPSQDTDTGPAF